jgi:hypothetical protein
VKRFRRESRDLYEGPGQHVLSGVLLHVVKPRVPIHAAIGGRVARTPGTGRFILEEMFDYATDVFPHVNNSKIADVPAIGQLPARFREKATAVENNGELSRFFVRFATDYFGLKFNGVGVVLIQLFRFR